MQNKTYSELFELISGLAGVSDFSATEETFILGFVNRRLYQAYRSSSAWPRYIIGPLPRVSVNGLIPRSFTPTTQNISAATRSNTKVTATLTGEPNFVAGMNVIVAGLSGAVTANGTFTVTSVGEDTFEYDLGAGTGSETYSGSGTVIAVALPNIDSFNRIWDNNPLGTKGSREYDFWVDVDGAHVINPLPSTYGYWVTAVKEFDGPYAANAVNIPQEFFQWAAHAAYADFLRLDRQTDKALAEETIAQQFLVLELDKAQQQSNQRLMWRISTHLSRQAR
jgi:hypothetical protein